MLVAWRSGHRIRLMNGRHEFEPRQGVMFLNIAMYLCTY
jgi:hypothetical protein